MGGGAGVIGLGQAEFEHSNILLPVLWGLGEGRPGQSQAVVTGSYMFNRVRPKYLYPLLQK